MIRYAEFQIDPRTGELLVERTRIVLPPRISDLLVTLAARPGVLVTREELYEKLWKGVCADYSKGLDTAVKQLRKALSAAGIQGVVIETLHRRGYRLLVESVSASDGRLSPGTQADRLYLEGFHCWQKRTPSALRNAIGFFEQARELDPRGARHHSAIAVSNLLLAGNGDDPPEELVAEADSAALEAIRLDNTDVTAFGVLGYIRGAFRYELRRAAHDLARVIEMNPDVAFSYIPYSYVLCASGEFAEARGAIEKAHTLDPLSPTIAALRGFTAYMDREFADALKLGHEATELDPEFGLGRFYHGQALLAVGRHEDAVRQFEIAVDLLEGGTPARAMLGAACALGEKPERAREIDRQLDAAAAAGYADPYHRAVLKDALGFEQDAADLLERAAGTHCHWFALARVDPKLERLRGNARVARLLRDRLGGLRAARAAEPRA